MRRPSSHVVSAARRRARLRRRSGGAVMFIVAMTLALLAVMGMYGLTATAQDISAAGHMRQAMQAQRAAEFSAMATAETFTPGTAAALVRVMTDPARSTTGLGAGKCKSITKTPTGLVENRNGEACLVLSEQQMATIAKSVNKLEPTTRPFCATADNCPFFMMKDTAVLTPSDGTFGDVREYPFLRVEATNPVDIPPPPGSGLDGRFTFTQITTTVFVDMKTVDLSASPVDMTSALNAPAKSVMVARGRMTVGPYYR
jgi:hypothetical protein